MVDFPKKFFQRTLKPISIQKQPPPCFISNKNDYRDYQAQGGTGVMRRKNQMKNLHVFLILLFICCCVDKASQIPMASKLVAKYVVRDESVTKEGSWGDCGRKNVPFLQMEENDCQFILANNEYRIWEKYVLDENGKVRAYWDYKNPNGPVSYSIKELRKDQKLLEHIGVSKVMIELLNSNTRISDSGNTVRIERFFSSEKLIFVKRDSSIDKAGFKTIYEYGEF